LPFAALYDLPNGAFVVSIHQFVRTEDQRLVPGYGVLMPLFEIAGHHSSKALAAEGCGT
jgi:hypothetical protein